VLADQVSRKAIFEALRSRRTYGTTGARLRLRVTGNGLPMGSRVRSGRAVAIRVEVAGTAPLAEIVLVKNGGEVEAAWSAPPGAESACLVFRDRLAGGVESSYYVRVRQVDEHLAWSSPFWYEFVPDGLPGQPTWHDAGGGPALTGIRIQPCPPGHMTAGRSLSGP
jgi:hypothetical protein